MRINDPRRLFLAALGTLCVERALPAQATDDAEAWGRFEVVTGKPGIVIGVPHATADAGTAEIGRVLCRRIGAGGIFASGFWFAKTRQRINVNRPTEQIIGTDSEVLRQWQSERARAANARYVTLVKDAAQGPLRAFYEIHSNHRPPLAGSIEVSTIGVSYRSARRFKDAFSRRAVASLPTRRGSTCTSRRSTRSPIPTTATPRRSRRSRGTAARSSIPRRR